VQAQHDQVITAKRYRVALSAGASVTTNRSAESKVVQVLPVDTIVVIAEVAIPAGGAASRVRISSPAGWMNLADLAEAPAISGLRFDWSRFEAQHEEVAPGDLYGLEFPFTISMIEEQGAEFLTRAFHAAGTMSRDNHVVAVSRIEPCHGGQAADKAFLDVEYARAEAGLRGELFVKMPASDVQRKFYLANTVPFEVEFARLSSRGVVPVDVPRFYFGDYNTTTSNYILITDRVGYGEGAIAPTCEKGFDHELPDAHERYLVLTKSLAALIAAHKSGDLGSEIESIFPFAPSAPLSRIPSQVETQLDKVSTFISETAPNLFPEWASQPDFLARFRADVLFGFEHVEEMARRLHADVDYVGLCHPNLNLDNAWFWRESDGVLHAGLLDWGMTRQMNISQALCGMLMFPEPETYSELVRNVIDTFVKEYESICGVRLEAATIRNHYKASLFLNSISMILEIVVDQFDQFSREEYRAMENRFDHGLQACGLSAGVIWVRNLVEDWNDGLTPAEAIREILDASPGSRTTS